MRFRAQLCSFNTFHRPCSHFEQSLLRIEASFCSFCITQTLILLFKDISAHLTLSLIFMDSTDLSLTHDSHCCASNFHSALLCIPKSLFSFSTVIITHPISIPLFLYIQQSLFSCSVIFAHLTSILLFLRIPQALISFSTVIITIQSPLISFYTFHRLCSHAQFIFGQLISILLFLCIPQALIAFPAVISTHPISILLFL